MTEQTQPGAGPLPPGYASQEPWQEGGFETFDQESPGGPRHSRRGRPPRRRRRFFFRIAIAVLAAILLLAGGGLLWAQSQINPGGHRGPDVAVVIPAGSSTTKIGKILSKDGVIHDATLFALYVRVRGKGPLLPGTYSLPKNSSYDSAISALEAGPKVVTYKLVIPEGFTIRDIATRVAALPGMHLSAQKFLTAARDGSVRSPYEPKGVDNLEGLLFPATYDVHPSDTEVDILEKMVGAFDDHANALGLTAAAAARHETPYKLVEVASIVEREAKLPQDRGPVASAIYNRLRKGMALGADSTQAYYLRLTDPRVTPSAAQYDSPSPYNTRLNPGLPPTPIANPGLAALTVAATPPRTTYLYWVQINPNGKLGFASTSDGFVQLQDQCRAANLC